MTSMSASRNAVISLQSYNTCIMKWILCMYVMQCKVGFFTWRNGYPFGDKVESNQF
jgi:hypothetical protein